MDWIDDAAVLAFLLIVYAIGVYRSYRKTQRKRQAEVWRFYAWLWNDKVKP